MAVKLPAEKNSSRKDLDGKKPARKRPRMEKSAGKKSGGEKPSIVYLHCVFQKEGGFMEFLDVTLLMRSGVVH